MGSEPLDDRTSTTSDSDETLALIRRRAQADAQGRTVLHTSPTARIQQAMRVVVEILSGHEGAAQHATDDELRHLVEAYLAAYMAELRHL